MSNRDAFTAIADPTRREILHLIHTHHSLAAGEIAEYFAASSRPGISRHLRVLKECGVVRSSRQGKEQIYSVNTEPLTTIRDGYLASFATMQTRSLNALRRKVEGQG